MRKAKIVFWVVVAAFFGLIFYENRIYFLAEHDMVINLLFVRYQIPELFNFIYILFFFLLGFLIAYFSKLYDRYKNKQVVKNLNQQLTARADTIARLETENESLKSAMTAPLLTQEECAQEELTEDPVKQENDRLKDV
jgi:cell shape-determining protein MreC